jgi:hypothetical protein
MSKWISVKEKLPSDGYYLLFSDGRQIGMGWFNHGRQEFIQVNTWADVSTMVTHWMPLPELPKD